MSFWQWFWLVVEIWFFFAYLVILFQIVTDLFRDTTSSGWVKALWVVLLLVAPVIGALLYLIFRGRGMTTRRIEAIRERSAAAEDYIRQVAGASPADEITKAQALLASGAITPDEFAALKARALAGQ